jgi:hypothetical protein
VHVAVEGDVDTHRVGGCGRLTDGPDVEPEPRPREVQGHDQRQGPGGVDEGRLVEENRPEHRQVAQAEDVDRPELVRRRVVREVELVAEVRGQPEAAGEDRERETGDDLARAQADGEKRVDEGHRRSRHSSGADREQEDRLVPRRGRRSSVHHLRDPEPDRGPEQHHPLDPEVQHPRPLREQLPERREEQRRSVQDSLREDDDEQAVVDHPTGSGEAAALPRERRPIRRR